MTTIGRRRLKAEELVNRNRADAEECFQEAALAALEFSRRKDVQHWRALLVRLATARAVDRLRRR
jgi:RNA polymerase sigma-70 factor, ECF subfamily